MWHSRILGGHAIIPIRSRNWETYLSVVFVEWKDEIRRRLARRQQRPSDLGSVCGRFHTWVRRTRCRRMPDIVATTRHGTVGISIGTGVGCQRPARVSKHMQRVHQVLEIVPTFVGKSRRFFHRWASPTARSISSRIARIASWAGVEYIACGDWDDFDRRPLSVYQQIIHY